MAGTQTLDAARKQMLAMSLGVAAAGTVLAGFTSAFGGSGDAATALKPFQATFVTMGLITLASAAIFWQPPPEVSGQG